MVNGGLTDILTAIKNGVVAMNNASNAILRAQGNATSRTTDGTLLVISGKGILVNFSVTEAGSAEGSIYNAASTSAIADTNKLVATPNLIGVYDCSQYFDSGLVIVVGTGQKINVTYFLEI